MVKHVFYPLPFESDRIVIIGELKKKLHDIVLKMNTYYLWENSVASYSFYFRIKLILENT